MDERRAELERLYREVGPQVWAYLRRRIADAGVAEDLFQETFAVVVADLGSVTAAACERAWLIGIARNVLRSHLRRAAGRRTVALPEDHAADGGAHDDPRLDAMRQAVARLPGGQREVLELRLQEDLSYADIADALEIPIGTVRSRMHNAVAALRVWATQTGIEKILEA